MRKADIYNNSGFIESISFEKMDFDICKGSILLMVNTGDYGRFKTVAVVPVGYLIVTKDLL